ncbi:MAG TPA: FtsX-like permease family protein [Thermoanaerobaculales bacterium]|nr:FtsX-like permease family protein [Thermoanaerobaculales bacterium]HPA80643.1 FtsX-like permease family protein [Thermoanaerobaculales bacterium]HQL30921.1 FtsX-like permease family protein [Thermoanaerobaculales bacterium]HQN97003.1 FtsX-like permease family protein [Thermoanaerobaculales bacterium]HQP43277.1 FtsX-like permease family protein [Thermoanaerobaculales bacterium]
MTLELELAVRFLRRRAGVLLRGTSLAAFVGVALATAALVITLALMSGYSQAIADALQRGNAHIVGFSGRAMGRDAANALAARIATVDGVRRATPVSYLAGLMDDPARPTNPVPITIKAISEPPAYGGLTTWPEAGSAIPALFGERLASSLKLAADDRVAVRLPPEPGSWIVPTITLANAGTFRLAFAEFDSSWVVLPLDATAAALPGTGAAGIEIEVVDPLAVAAVRDRLEDAHPELLYTDWREMNRSLFAVLRWQTLSLFVVLSLVVAVASFQVASALVVLAIDKRRSAGMLQALGATPAVIRRVLVLAGLLLGGSAVVAGIVVGCAASWLMTAARVVRFPEGLARVYMVDSIPFRPEPAHLLAVLAVCSALVLVASLGPAWRTSREDPVASLRAV